MHRLYLLLIGSVVGLAALLWLSLQPAAPALPSGHFAIRDVRMFDGERFVPRANVLVRDGRIEAAGSDVRIPAGVAVVDGEGRTLLPGLIDAHVHSFGDARRDALRFGVTSVIDMFSDPRGLPAARDDRDGLANHDQADLWSAGMLATAAGGHGTQFATAVVPVDAAAQASDWVAARRAEGSDFIKLVREDLHVYSDARHLPSLDAPTAAALIAAAHAQGLRAVVHASAQEDARQSLADGADGLVHVFQDAVADAGFVALARERDAFVVPTLSVIASFAGQSLDLAGDERLAEFLSPSQRDQLAATMGFGRRRPELYANARESVRRLHAVGVRILAGSDAPNPGTAHGVALHGELAHLVAAGLTPTAALAAATSVPATAFGITDRGRIAPGMRADLLLVEGDPEQDIEATRAIVAVWKNGQPVDRKGEPEVTRTLRAGVLGDFDDAQQHVDDRRWLPTSDRMAGGRSEAALARIADGAAGSAAALRVQGRVDAGSPQRWAGVFFNPGDAPMQPVDARGLSRLRLHLRGDGKPLAVLLFSGASGAPPQVRQISTGADWSELNLPLTEFAGVDLARLRGIAISTSEPGAFSFDLDQITVE